MPGQDEHFVERRTGRPRASLMTLINGGILGVMLLSGGVYTVLFLAAIKTDLTVLQSQVSDLRNWSQKLSDKVDTLVAETRASRR